MYEAGFCVADGVYSVVMVDAMTKAGACAASERHAQKHNYSFIYCKQITEAEVEECRAKGMPVIKANEADDEILQMLDRLSIESKRKFYQFLIALTHRENDTTAPLTVLDASERMDRQSRKK